jgi:multidrug resistance efflux pump
VNVNSSTTLGSLVDRRPVEQEIERLQPDLEQAHRAKQRIRTAVASLDKACAVFVAEQARVAELEDIQRLSPDCISQVDVDQAAHALEAAQRRYREAYDRYRCELAVYGEAVVVSATEERARESKVSV